MKRPSVEKIAGAYRWKHFFLVLIIIFSVFSMFLCVREGNAAQTTLVWNPPTANEDGTPLTGLAGYKIYYGTASRSYTQNIDVGNITTYTVPNLSEGVTYYFAATAYNTSQKESTYSNEISRTMSITLPKQHTLKVSKGETGKGKGSVTSSPGGIICGADCTEAYNTGTTVTLSALPDGNSVFSGWSGACTGTGACAVTMDAANSVTATFTLKTYTITATAGSGGSISPAGSVVVNYGNIQSFTITPSTNYNIGNVTVDGSSVGSVTTYTFTNVTANHTISATFTALQPNTLTVNRAGTGTGIVSSSPLGIICGSDCTEVYNAGTLVTLTATPDGSSTFSGWSGACTGTGACTVTMDASKAVTATFTLNTYTISATTGAGGSISPSGLVTVNHGASQMFSITPATNYTVGNVVVDGSSAGAVTTYTFTNVTANHTISASFTVIQQNSLNITKSGTGTGTVISSPEGIICGSDCTEVYNAGTLVTLTATPDGNSTFSGWSGACAGTGACIVTIDAAKSITATFTLKTYTITATAGTGGSISPSGSILVNHGATQVVSITLNTDYKIEDVLVDGKSVGAVSTYTFTGITSNHTISAMFTINTYPNISVIPGYYNFGNVPVGGNISIQTFSVTNMGAQDLNLGTNTIDGLNPTEFLLTDDNCSGRTIKPAEKCTVSVVFLPTSGGLKSAHLLIPSNDPDTLTSDVPLEGLAVVETESITQLPQTGQEISYAVGDDGDVQAGVRWPEPRFTDNGDGTVTDMLTGLMWLKDGGCLSKKSWSDALNAVSDFNTAPLQYGCAGYAGAYTDWRVPDIREIESLINYGVADTSGWLNISGFTNIRSSYYWSSTTYQSGIQAWVINMLDGKEMLASKKKGNYVLAVRVMNADNHPYSIPMSGQTVSYAAQDDGNVQVGAQWPEPRFFDNGDGTVTDTLTGLMWLKDGGCLNRKNWSGALITIVEMNENPGRYNCLEYSANYSDWRVPNVRELESMLNYGVSDSSLWLNTGGFSNIKSSSYWTSTAAGFANTQGWKIDMKRAKVLPVKMRSNLYIWPVRSVN